MRNIFVSLAFMLMLAFGSVAQAAQLDMNNLSEAAQAELALQAAQLRKDAFDAPVIPDIAEVEKYVGVGEQIGRALAVTARELGIEVNNFATSPVGMSAIFLIVWHFFGSMMVHLVFGAGWFLTMVPIWIYFFKRLVMGREETYDADTGKRVSVKYGLKGSADTVATFIITGIVIFMVGVIGIFSF